MSRIAESIQTLLKCPICLEPFYNPRMLTCLHSLCYGCLNDHIRHNGDNGLFQCPVCKKSLQIPADGAEAFPDNFFINSCMDAVTDKGTGARSKTGQTSRARSGRQETRSERECSNFELDLQCAQPNKFCLDCCEYFCNNCSRIHRKSKSSRDHVQVALDDLTDEMLKDAKSKSEAPRCQKHKDKILEMYCSTCECAVCYLCSQTRHKSHTLRDVADVDDDLKSELGEVMESLQDLIDDGEEETVQIKQSQQMAERNISSAIKTTKGVFQKMSDMQEEKAKQIVQKLTKMRKDLGANKNDQRENLTLHTQLLGSLHTFTDDLLKRGTVYNRLASLPEVRNRLQEFQESPLASADGATDTEIPDSADLVATHLDGMELEEKVKLSGPDSTEARTVTIKTTCSMDQDKVDGRSRRGRSRQTNPTATGPVSTPSVKPKLSVVLYNRRGWGGGRDLVDVTVQSLNTRLTCDISDTDTTPLQPEVNDRPQVDVIYCWGNEIDSVVNDYNITDTTAGHRHLVLVHRSDYGSLTETRRALGQHVKHFKSIIWCGADEALVQAVIDSLADCFRQVGCTT